MEYSVPAALILLAGIVKSPLAWASIVGFIVSFKAGSGAKKYLMGGCALVLIAYLAELVFNAAMPVIWNAEGLSALEISKNIVRYSRIFEVVSAAGLLLVVRAGFIVGQYKELNKEA